MTVLPVAELARISGCCQSTIRERIAKGLTGDQLTAKPKGRGGHYKITEQQARKCWELMLDGCGVKEAAAQSGISYGQAENIKYGTAWNHITGLPKYDRDDW